MDSSKRLKLRITALTLASTLILNGCGGKDNSSFKFVENENNELVSVDGSYISKDYIKNYYVVEMFNNLTNENELFIARRKGTNINYKYIDVFTNFKIYDKYYAAVEEDVMLKLIKVSNLSDYIIALGFEQLEYSYDDMKNIYDVIKENYVFEDNSSLKKRILDYKI